MNAGGQSNEVPIKVSAALLMLVAPIVMSATSLPKAAALPQIRSTGGLVCQQLGVGLARHAVAYSIRSKSAQSATTPGVYGLTALAGNSNWNTTKITGFRFNYGDGSATQTVATTASFAGVTHPYKPGSYVANATVLGKTTRSRGVSASSTACTVRFTVPAVSGSGHVCPYNTAGCRPAPVRPIWSPFSPRQTVRP